MDIKNIKAVVTNKPQSDYYIYCLLHTEFIPSCLKAATEITESFRLEKTFTTIMSNSKPNTAKATTKLPPQGHFILQPGSLREASSEKTCKQELSLKTKVQCYSCLEQSILHSTSSDSAK